MRWKLAVLVGCAAWFCASPARAHHGVASVGFSDPEGPGVGIETTAALPLPRRLGFAMAKSEFVSFQSRDDRAAFPEQKDIAWFNMAALGFGIAPWLSAYVFQPYNLKSMDGGVGGNTGLGDTSVMLAFGWKWDEGLRLIPQKESLDELRDWHFLLWASCTLPVGSTEHRDARGEPFAPDMQTGFGAPSPAVGLAALKQVSTDFTVLAEVNYQYFFPHSYAFSDASFRYQFGAETRASGAAAYRAYGKGRVRFDVVAEASGLHLQRDRDSSDATQPNTLLDCQASGGGILYGSLGMRAYLGRFALGLGVKRAMLKWLNEESDQQGSEGLERFRLAFIISGTTQF
jgi:hypothetical protein